MRLQYLTSAVKVRLGNWLSAPWIGGIIYTLHRGWIPCDGHWFDLRLNNNVLFHQAARLWWGFYEKSERQLIRRYLNADLDVIELGSGAGVISCAILKKLRPERSIVCVEGNPFLAQTLRKNIDRNYPARKGVTIIQKVVNSSGAGQTYFQMDENLLGSSVDRAGHEKHSVATTRLQDILVASQFSTYSLVCDIEGAEAGILLHEQDMLARCDQIIIELHSTEFGGKRYSVGDLKNLIEALNFSCVAARHNVFVFQRSCATKS